MTTSQSWKEKVKQRKELDSDKFLSWKEGRAKENLGRKFCVRMEEAAREEKKSEVEIELKRKSLVFFRRTDLEALSRKKLFDSQIVS